MNWLVASRHYHEIYEAQKASRWIPYSEFSDVQDSVSNRVGILGYGSIGRQGT